MSNVPSADNPGGPKAVPVQGSSGGFKLKLKLGKAPGPAPPPAPSSSVAGDDEDEEEDQLASSSSDDEGASNSMATFPHQTTAAMHTPAKGRASVTVRRPDDDDEDAGHASRLSSIAPSEDARAQYNSMLHPSSAAALHGGGETTSTSMLSDADATSIASHPLSDAEASAAADPKPPPLKKARKSQVGQSKGRIKGVVPSGDVSLGDVSIPSVTGSSKKKRKSQNASSLAVSPFAEDPYTIGGYGIAVPPPLPRRQPHDPALGPPPPPPVSELRPLPVAPPPKPQSGFLPAQPLERRLPPVRRWKKVLREIVSISGISYKVWTYAGEPHSDYANAKQAQQFALQQSGIAPPSGSSQSHPLYYPYPPTAVTASTPGSYNPYEPMSSHQQPTSHLGHPSSMLPPPQMPPPVTTTPSLGVPVYTAGASGTGGPPLPPSFRAGGDGLKAGDQTAT